MVRLSSRSTPRWQTTHWQSDYHPSSGTIVFDGPTGWKTVLLTGHIPSYVQPTHHRIGPVRIDRPCRVLGFGGLFVDWTVN